MLPFVNRPVNRKWWLCCTLIGLSACFNAHQSKSTSEKKAQSPLKEGYLEYLGPHEKWAGPSDFMIHVNTRIHLDHDPGKAQVVFTGGPFDQPETLWMTSQQAQEILGRLQLAISDQKTPTEKPFCSAPIHLRLIKEDGMLQEVYGCREVQGWSKAMSEVTASLLEKLANSTEH